MATDDRLREDIVALCDLASFEDAAVAYEQYLTRYRSDHRRIQTALLLALLYVRKRPNPTRARELLDEFEPLAREELHLQLVSELRKELDG